MEQAKPHHAADRLLAISERKGAPVCVGLDPVRERLPKPLTDLPPLEAIERFCVEVIEVVARHVPAIKPQVACFERYGSDGLAVYERVVAAGRQAGLFVVGDAKRGDIGISAGHYAAGHLEGPAACDALTVNAYLGVDGLEPFVESAAAVGRGLFALVRTSNPGGDALQRQRLADGRTVAEAVADLVAEAGRGSIGERGYSLLGAVVGATKPAEAAALRERMPQQLFLVPGFGAQGGTADDVRACFKPDGTGALITASRSVIYAFNPSAEDWQHPVAQAAEQLQRDVAAILK